VSETRKKKGLKHKTAKNAGDEKTTALNLDTLSAGGDCRPCSGTLPTRMSYKLPRTARLVEISSRD